jgi:hypothetical protein
MSSPGGPAIVQYFSRSPSWTKKPGVRASRLRPPLHQSSDDRGPAIQGEGAAQLPERAVGRDLPPVELLLDLGSERQFAEQGDVDEVPLVGGRRVLRPLGVRAGRVPVPGRGPKKHSHCGAPFLSDLPTPRPNCGWLCSRRQMLVSPSSLTRHQSGFPQMRQGVVAVTDFQLTTAPPRPWGRDRVPP